MSAYRRAGFWVGLAIMFRAGEPLDQAYAEGNDRWMPGKHALDEPDLLAGFPDISLLQPIQGGIHVPGISLVQHFRGFQYEFGLHRRVSARAQKLQAGPTPPAPLGRPSPAVARVPRAGKTPPQKEKR